MYNCQTLGYKFKILKGYKYKGTKTLFKKYVKTMYNLRSMYIKDNPLNLIAKLLMNSLYGKFGLKATKTVVEIFDFTKKRDINHLKKFLDTYGDNFDSYTPIDGRFIITDRKDVSNYHYTESQDLFFGLDVGISYYSTPEDSSAIYGQI